MEKKKNSQNMKTLKKRNVPSLGVKNATSIQEFYQQKNEFKSPKKWNTNLKDTKHAITAPTFTA